MRTRILDHIDLRVKDLARAREFYGKLLPALGFTCDRSDAKYGTFYSVGGDKPSAFFAFEQDRQHQPNATRIAFWGETRAEVDRIAKLETFVTEQVEVPVKCSVCGDKDSLTFLRVRALQIRS